MIIICLHTNSLPWINRDLPDAMKIQISAWILQDLGSVHPIRIGYRIIIRLSEAALIVKQEGMLKGNS
jgi:hypothetical protein